MFDFRYYCSMEYYSYNGSIMSLSISYDTLMDEHARVWLRVCFNSYATNRRMNYLACYVEGWVCESMKISLSGVLVQRSGFFPSLLSLLKADYL